MGIVKRQATEDFVTEQFGNFYLKSEADTLHTEILAYVDDEVAALVNSAPETLDTLGELAAAFEENQDIVATLDAAITMKSNIPNIVTSASGSIVLNDNTEYYLTDVSSLALSYPNGNFEVWMNVQFASTGTVAITFPSSTNFIGTLPAFANSQTWEISIKNGTAICWRVE